MVMKKRQKLFLSKNLKTLLLQKLNSILKTNSQVKQLLYLIYVNLMMEDGKSLTRTIPIDTL